MGREDARHLRLTANICFATAGRFGLRHDSCLRSSSGKNRRLRSIRRTKPPTGGGSGIRRDSGCFQKTSRPATSLVLFPLVNPV
jgi:hypothetical protein